MLVTAEEAALSGAPSCLAEGVEPGCEAPGAPVLRQVGAGVGGVHGWPRRQPRCRFYEWGAAEPSALY